MPPGAAWAWTPCCAAVFAWFGEGPAVSGSWSTPPVEWTLQSVARLNAGGLQSIDRYRAAVLELETQWAKAIGPARKRQSFYGFGAFCCGQEPSESHGRASLF